MSEFVEQNYLSKKYRKKGLLDSGYLKPSVLKNFTDKKKWKKFSKKGSDHCSLQHTWFSPR